MQNSISHLEGWQPGPLDQFQTWFAAMLAAGQPEPYTMRFWQLNLSDAGVAQQVA